MLLWARDQFLSQLRTHAEAEPREESTKTHLIGGSDTICLEICPQTGGHMTSRAKHHQPEWKKQGIQIMDMHTSSALKADFPASLIIISAAVFQQQLIYQIYL